MTPLFLLRISNGVTILLVDVDDIIISGTYPDGILPLQKELHASLHMKDLGHLTYFLGLEVHKLKGGSLLININIPRTSLPKHSFRIPWMLILPPN